jgi:hypothetical protein
MMMMMMMLMTVLEVIAPLCSEVYWRIVLVLEAMARLCRDVCWRDRYHLPQLMEETTLSVALLEDRDDDDDKPVWPHGLWAPSSRV